MILKGKAYWAKLGDPVQNAFDPTVTEWSFDLCNLTPETVETIKQTSGKSVKNKGDDREDFYTFKRRATKKDGEKAKPFEIVDAHGNPWPRNKLIGNGSEVHVLASVREYKFGGKPGKTLSAIKLMVWDYVPFEAREDFEYKPQGEEDVQNTKNW